MVPREILHLDISACINFVSKGLFLNFQKLLIRTALFSKLFPNTHLILCIPFCKVIFFKKFRKSWKITNKLFRRKCCRYTSILLQGDTQFDLVTRLFQIHESDRNHSFGFQKTIQTGPSTPDYYYKQSAQTH